MAASLRDKLPGSSPQSRQLRERIREVADGDTPILIEGERGSGREWVARVLHTLGPRKGARFVCVDPDEHADLDGDGSSEGGRIVDGDLRRANGGTLLVKEVAHVGRGPQRRLLRAIRKGPMRREPSGE